MAAAMKRDRILRLPAVKEATGLSRATIYRKMDAEPDFPQSFPIGIHSVGWYESEVQAWIAKQGERRPKAA